MKAEADRRLAARLLGVIRESFGDEVGDDELTAAVWIGNTYLDDSGRDSPASLNSTGDM